MHSGYKFFVKKKNILQNSKYMFKMNRNNKLAMHYKLLRYSLTYHKCLLFYWTITKSAIWITCILNSASLSIVCTNCRWSNVIGFNTQFNMVYQKNKNTKQLSQYICRNWADQLYPNLNEFTYRSYESFLIPLRWAINNGN